MTALHRTKIVCTLGPASQEEAVIRRMILAGTDVFRMNASHGTPEEHAERIARVRRVSRALGQPVGVLVDLPGPKFRLARLASETRVLRKGDRVMLTQPEGRPPMAIPVRNPAILKAIRPGHQIFLADGTIQLAAAGHEGGASSAACRWVERSGPARG